MKAAHGSLKTQEDEMY